MSVPKITYDVFSEDPFIEKLTLDEGTKGAYDILKWAYHMVSQSCMHVVLCGKHGAHSYY